MQNVFGWNFLNIFAAAYYGGRINLPFELSYFTLLMVMTKNPVIMVLLGLASLAGAYYMMCCCYLNSSRIWLAQALDGVLPEWFVKVSKKHHFPVNAQIAEWFVVFLWIILFSFWSDFYWVVYSGFCFCWWAGMIPTAIAAILFPWIAPKIYKVSPASKYHPLTVIAGLGMLIPFIYASWQIWFVPELGAASLIPRLTITLLLFGSLLYFLFYRAYQKRRGINVDLAFKEIPPE
jgi:amino acid transporter